MKRAQGFSLIELMLALALGVVVTAGIVTLFVGNNQTYTLLNGQSRMQENARFAVDFITRSARAAGYFGCDPEQGKIYKTLNGAWNQIFEFDITTPIQAYHGVNNGNSVNDWTPSLTTLPRVGSVVGYIAANGVDVSRLRPQSDVLVLRHVQIPGARIAAIVHDGFESDGGSSGRRSRVCGWQFRRDQQLRTGDGVSRRRTSTSPARPQRWYATPRRRSASGSIRTRRLRRSRRRRSVRRGQQRARCQPSAV